MADARQHFSVEYLASLFAYDPETGALSYRSPPSNFLQPGAKAGSVNRLGWCVVMVQRKALKVHRVAWALHCGIWPTQPIDHINGNRADNRIANLRLATPKLNAQNKRRATKANKCGVLGACMEGKTFRARIKVDGRNLTIGRFNTAEEAHVAYVEAKRRLHEGCTL